MRTKRFINDELRRVARRLTNLPIASFKNKPLQSIKYEGKKIY